MDNKVTISLMSSVNILSQRSHVQRFRLIDHYNIQRNNRQRSLFFASSFNYSLLINTIGAEKLIDAQEYSENN